MTFSSEAPTRLRELAEAWADVNMNERAVFQPWLLRFCEALGVAAPEPPTDAYRFELPVSVVDREGRESINYIDCWKAGHFALEAKASRDDLRSDAVLAWDEIVHRPERDRPDSTPRIVSPITGEMIPDPNAKLPYYEYVGAKQADWPQADYIIGNPPYIGEKRQRDTLGDGYVDALRSAYPAIGASVDFVMYWWVKSADRVIAGETVRAGLITTNSITQSKNRAAVAAAMNAGARIIWAAPDHPWVEDADGAAIRVAMTVVARESALPVRRYSVTADGAAMHEHVVATFNADLAPGVNVAAAAATELRSNAGISHQGFKIGGAGFMLTAAAATTFLAQDARNIGIVRPIRNARDLSASSRNSWVIDLGLRDENDALETPMLYDHLRATVYGERQANARESYRRLWWRFLEPRRELRNAIAGLLWYICTPEVSKHRFFARLDADVAPDGTLVVIALSHFDALGILSSRFHVTWALAAGGRLGVGNDPRYNKSVCFDAFPFPDPTPDLRDRIAAIAERLDAHRKTAIARDERVTMTGMYNVVDKLRSGEALTPKERAIHEIAAGSVLRDIHDELDALVAESYGWPWPMEKEEILERLVALHDERVEEESRGMIRWLRPEYQIPRFAPAAAALTLAIPAGEAKPAAAAERPAWPSTAVEQLSAIGVLVAQCQLNPDEIAASFTGAQRALIARHLETLELMGEVTQDSDGRYGVARKVA